MADSTKPSTGGADQPADLDTDDVTDRQVGRSAERARPRQGATTGDIREAIAAHRPPHDASPKTGGGADTPPLDQALIDAGGEVVDRDGRDVDVQGPNSA